jgi:DNA-binding Lrp family transcriptional regulator
VREMVNMIKEKELLLMSYFRSNARLPLTKLSKLTNIPVSTIFDKLREYEKGIIRKHTSLLDFRKLGFDIKVQMLFRVTKSERDNFQGFLLRNPKVNNVLRINNGYDFLAEAIFRDMKDLNEFCENLESFGIEEKKDFFVLEDLKREEFLSNIKNLGIVM